MTSNLRDTFQLLQIMGVVFVLSTTVVSIYFAKKIAKPIVILSRFSEAVGAGDLDNKINLDSTDEIGQLADSYNKMVDNLKNTMASKKLLLDEVNKRKKAEKDLKKLTVTDELTQIYNRRAANEFVEIFIERAQRYDEKFSVLILDVDHFKKVNDNYCHDVGDTVLVKLAKILSENIRNVDIVARIGGEEFIILLPQNDKNQGLILAERIRIAISEFEFDRVEHITVSIGLSEYLADDSLNTLLKRADNALYASKHSGRNRVSTQ